MPSPNPYVNPTASVRPANMPQTAFLWFLKSVTGWLMRQALKWGTLGGTYVTAWLISNGAEQSKATVIGTAVGTLALLITETVLSKLSNSTPPIPKALPVDQES